MPKRPEGGDGATSAQESRGKQPRLESMHGGAPSAGLADQAGPPDAPVGERRIDKKKEAALEKLQTKLDECGIMVNGVHHRIGHFLPHCLRPPDPDKGESGPPRPDQVSTPISAEFWKGKAYEIETQRATKQKEQVKQLVTLEGKDEGEHFEFYFQCRGGKDGKPCRYKQNLMCRFCPATQFPQLSDGAFRSWGNPVLCGTDADVVRNAWTHVRSKKGWHMFWYAVHRLYELHPGLAAAGAVPVTADPDHIQKMLEYLKNNAHRLQANKEAFRCAGLLDPAGVGQEFGIAAKFERAEQALRYFNISQNLPKRGAAAASLQSRSETPTKDESYDNEESKLPRMYIEQQVMPGAAASSPAPTDSDPLGLVSLPLTPRGTPGAAHHGQAFIASYNVNDTPIDEATMFADACLNDPDEDPSGGLPMHHESMRTHRPILNLLFDSALLTERAVG